MTQIVVEDSDDEEEEEVMPRKKDRSAAGRRGGGGGRGRGEQRIKTAMEELESGDSTEQDAPARDP